MAPSLPSFAAKTVASVDEKTQPEETEGRQGSGADGCRRACPALFLEVTPMIHNAMNMNVSAYRRRAADASPSNATSLGGMPGANQSFATAKAGVAQVGSTLKNVQRGMTIGGGVFIALGVLAAIVLSLSAGISLAVTGGIMIAVARFGLSEFFGGLGEIASTVNALDAQAQLARTGIPTTARVIAMQPTGTLINHNPQVQTALEVQGPTGPYLVNTTAVINQMYIPQFQPGATVNLRVNPQNPYDVAVVF